MVLLSSPLQYALSTPPTTRALTAATLFFSLLYFWFKWQSLNASDTPYLTLIPGPSLFYPWVFLVSGFVETTVIELFFTLLFVTPACRYLEKLWGSFEMAKFIAITITVSNILSFGLNWLEYVVFRNADLFLYGMEYHGQMALQTGLLVAFTQIIPEHQVQLFGVLKVRVKRLPMAYLGLCNVMIVLGYQAPWLNIQWGWLVSWIYLRFYKRTKGDGISGDYYGDRNETFAFIYWFPPFVHGPLSKLCDSVHSVALQLNLLPKGHSADIESGSGGYTQVPGGPRAEAERRRALALKALDQRMAAAAGAPTGSGGQIPAPPRLPPSVAIEPSGSPISRVHERQVTDPNNLDDPAESKGKGKEMNT